MQLLRALPPGRERVCAGLGQYYRWYQRNGTLVSHVLRDAETHAITGETVELRWAPIFREAGEVLGEALNGRSRPLLGMALGFACYRALAGELTADEAAALMTDAILSV